LDKATQNQLARGQRLRELHKQSQPTPLTVEERIITIYTGTNGYLDSLEIDQWLEYCFHTAGVIGSNPIIGTLSKYIPGQLSYYPAFQSAIRGEKLSRVLRRDFTRETTWKAVMCIRCRKEFKHKEAPYQESKNPLIGGAGPNNGVLGGGGGGGSIVTLLTMVSSTFLLLNKYVKVQ
ncbi:hypothetical protein RYX36_010811, partial [Vicia faba]